ncbi:MAG TPA: hypothetical protein VD997_11695 [Phycisphaerales bacterium]|nr:hypothetical protein [Phycisphaerales bacterium]
MTTRITAAALFAAALLTSLPAVTVQAQVYQRADTTPLSPGGGANPATNLQAVAGTPDGGHIAVGREGFNMLHMARYDAAGNVIWSKFSPTNWDASCTSINQVGAGANARYIIAGEMADAFPWGTWVMTIDLNGNVTCPMREINGVGPNSPASRSPVAVKPLADQSYVVTGRSQAASTAPTFGRLTRFSAGCGAVMWSRVYTPTAGVEGLTGSCEITDVVEEPEFLLAVGTAALSNGGGVPFLLRVNKLNGAVVQAFFYNNGDPSLKVHGDGLAAAMSAAGGLSGFVFDGRSTPVAAGSGGMVSNQIVKVDLALNVVWGRTIREFEPCHACVRTSGTNTLVAGTRVRQGIATDVWGELLDTAGTPIWAWNYGRGNERGNGVTIAAPGTTGSPQAAVIVGNRTTATAPTLGGYHVRASILTGLSGGCEEPAVPPTNGAVRLGAQFTSTFVQHLRGVELPLIPEDLRTVNACLPLICCDVDFNKDGDIGTDADIESFFACLGGNCCPDCPPDADFNCDGDIGTDADIESFFRVLGGGEC